ncbi:uncharacterized protein LOC118734086 [Rhagoletis pomonella]|uniref:uncharacterized protein LOC118734086 n=1 Tax=Rhagoletis pomonella TaxID=28610 RepID=UPI0017822C55|nr:uncharacterized protein LOC118734086 [Rhagoletis pomonella]
MSQAEIRAQKQREQNERRLSVQRNNAYFSIRSQSDSESAKPNPSTTLKPPQDSAATTTSTVTCFRTSIAPTTTTNTPVPADCTAVSTAQPTLAAQAQINLSASTGNKGKAQEKLKNETTKNAAIQTGMDRYITIKRKLSPQNSTGSKTKINRLTSTQQVSTNRFALLSDNADDVNSQISEGAAKATNAKPPPIFIREENPSALVKKFTQLIGSIEPSVEAVEVLEALKEQGFNPKTAVNILNRNKIPQPMFKVELEPENKPLGKNDVHPNYKLQYLLHRRITVEEPHKRNGPVQCTNCQEYGHTRSYCTLRSVCVDCGELHVSATCTSTKEDPRAKKCSYCGGNHTANYRGCPVYKELKNRINQRVASIRTHNVPNAFVPSQTNPDVFFAKRATSPTVLSNTVNGVSFASALKSSLENRAPTKTAPQVAPQEQHPHAPYGKQSNIEAMIASMQQSMMNFMTFTQNTMQELMRNQNTLLNLLATQQTR